MQFIFLLCLKIVEKIGFRKNRKDRTYFIATEISIYFTYAMHYLLNFTK